MSRRPAAGLHVFWLLHAAAAADSHRARSPTLRPLQPRLPPTTLVTAHPHADEFTIFMAGWLPDPTLAVAAHGSMMQVSGFAYMVPMGLSCSVSVRVSNALGAGLPRAARRAAYTATALTFLTQASLSTTLVLGRGVWGRVFTDLPQVVALCAAAFPIMAICMVSWQALGAGVVGQLSCVDAALHSPCGLTAAHPLAALPRRRAAGRRPERHGGRRAARRRAPGAGSPAQPCIILGPGPARRLSAEQQSGVGPAGPMGRPVTMHVRAGAPALPVALGMGWRGRLQTVTHPPCFHPLPAADLHCARPATAPPQQAVVMLVVLSRFRWQHEAQRAADRVEASGGVVELAPAPTLEDSAGKLSPAASDAA